MSFSLLKTLVPPSAISCAAYGRLTGSNQLNLIVARSSVLQIYRVTQASSPNNSNKSQPQQQTSLSLVLEKVLFGRIESIATFRPPGWPRDLLAVSCHAAKMVVFQFDVSAFDLAIVSMHYFETADVHQNDLNYVRPPIMRIDPNNKCAAVLAYDRNIMIVPFRGEFMVPDALDVIDDFRPLPTSYALNLDEHNIKHIKDFVFLEGYHQPTLMILHDATLTWSGREAQRHSTGLVTVVSLDTDARRAPLVWRAEHLPHTAERLVAAPAGLGGALVVTLNALLYVNQATRLALPCNALAHVDAARFTLLPASSSVPAFNLGAARGTFIARTAALLSLQSGALLVVRVDVNGTTACGFSLRHLGRAPHAAAVVSLPNHLVFVASRVASSLLLHVKPLSASERHAAIVARQAQKKAMLEAEREAERLALLPQTNEFEDDVYDNATQQEGADDAAHAGDDDIDDDFADPFELAARHGGAVDDDNDDDDDADENNDNDNDEQRDSDTENDDTLHRDKRARTDNESFDVNASADLDLDEDNPYKVMLIDAATTTNNGVATGSGVKQEPTGAAHDGLAPPITDDMDSKQDAALRHAAAEQAAAAARAFDITATQADHDLTQGVDAQLMAQERQRRRVADASARSLAAGLFEAAPTSDDERDGDDVDTAGALFALSMTEKVPVYAVHACDVLTNLGPTSSVAVGRVGGRPPRLSAAAIAARSQRNRSRSSRHQENELVDDDALLELNEHDDDDDDGNANGDGEQQQSVEASIVALPFENRPGLQMTAQRSRRNNKVRSAADALKEFERELRARLTRVQRDRRDDAERLAREWSRAERERDRRRSSSRRSRHSSRDDRSRSRDDEDWRKFVAKHEEKKRVLAERYAKEDAARDKETRERRAVLTKRAEASQEAQVAEEYAQLIEDEERGTVGVDVVTCAGTDVHGCLKVMQRSVRPSVRNTLSVPACGAVYTLYAGAAHDEDGDDRDAHSLIVLSTPTVTRVLSTGQQLQEVSEQYEFVNGFATLNAFNLFGRTKIAQVYARGVRLLDGTQVVQDIKFERSDASIVASSAADPHVLLLHADGTLSLLTCRADVEMLSLSHLISAPANMSAAGAWQVTAACLFTRPAAGNDERRSPFEALHSDERRGAVVPTPSSSHADHLADGDDKSAMALDDAAPLGGMTAEEEELALFGTIVSAKPEAHDVKPVVDGVDGTNEENADDDANHQTVTHYVALTRASGALEIYSLPDMVLCFAAQWFSRRLNTVQHSQRAAAFAENSNGAQNLNKSQTFKKEKDQDSTHMQEPRVVELLIAQLSDENALDDRELYLTALLENGDLLVYKAFRCVLDARNNNQLLPLRWSRIDHGYVRRRYRAPRASGTGAAEWQAEARGDASLLRPMGSVGGLACIVVGGSRPVWLMHVRGALRVHPMALGDGERNVVSFAPFHHHNCQRGFVYYEPQSKELRVCQVPLGGTPHHVLFDRGSGLYIVAVSQRFETTRVSSAFGQQQGSFLQQQQQQQQQANGADRGVPVYEEKFELRLLNPATWETMDRYVLEESEHALVLRSCRLKHNATRSLRTYLVVGTGYSRGEDEATSGRVLVFEVLMPHMLLRNVSVKPEKSPCSALAEVCGHLLVATGMTIYVYDFSDGSVLTPCAFVDLEFYVVSADALKNYVVLADAEHGLHFFRWRDTRQHGRHLLLLGRDYNTLSTTAAAFVVDEPALGMAGFDAHGNVQIFQYAPRSAVSRRGQRLVCRAELAVGDVVTSAVRSRCNRVVQLPATATNASSSSSRRHSSGSHTNDHKAAMTRNAEQERMLRDLLQHDRQCVFYVTREGSLGVITPISEVPFRRLRTVLEKLQAAIAWPGGLPPAAHRAAMIDKNSEPSPDRSRLLDADALLHYATVDIGTQKDIARMCGTTSSIVMNNLLEVEATIDVT